MNKVKRVMVPCGVGTYREHTVTSEQRVGGQLREVSRVAGGWFREAVEGDDDVKSSFNEATFSPVLVVAIDPPPDAPLEVVQEAKAAPDAQESSAPAGAEVTEEEVGSKKKAPKAAKPKTPRASKPKVAKPKAAKASKPKVAKTPKPKVAKASKSQVVKPKATKAAKALKAAKPKAPKALKPKTAKVAKPPVTKAVSSGAKSKPASGQSGEAIDFFSPGKDGKRPELNPGEHKVLVALSQYDSLPLRSEKNNAGDPSLTQVFSSSASDVSQACSWARNALRRLVRGGLVEKKSRGWYSCTALGVRASKAPTRPEKAVVKKGIKNRPKDPPSGSDVEAIGILDSPVDAVSEVLSANSAELQVLADADPSAVLDAVASVEIPTESQSQIADP